MIKVMLAQILYKPAIIDGGLDWLEEPGIYNRSLGVSFFSLFQKQLIDDESIYHSIRENYVEYFQRRLLLIVNWAIEKDVDLLVFPEYSIPYQCLPILYELSKKNNITIIAGSHTVILSCEVYYNCVGLKADLAKEHIGESITPIFFPDGKTKFQCKLKKSIFELSMNLPDEKLVETFICHTKSGEDYPFSVLTCVDALEMQNLSLVESFAEKYDSQGYILIAPSCSPDTEAFYKVAKILDLHGITFLYCNSAQYGSSGVYLNDKVKFRWMFSGDAESIAYEKEEKIVEICFEPKQNFAISRQIDRRIIGDLHIVPIYYNNETNWAKAYCEELLKVQCCIKENNIYEAENILDSFLISNQYNLSDIVLKHINNFLSKLGNFAGDSKELLKLIEALVLDIYDIKIFFGNEIGRAMEICIKVGYKAYDNLKPLMIMSENYKEGIAAPMKACFPKEVAGIQISSEEVNAFRDRGNFITMLQRYVNDDEAKTILVSGAYGIGKTTFVDAAFKKHYPDWTVIKIKLPSKTRFSMILEQIGSAIDFSVSADLLSRVGKNQLRPYMKKIVENIFSTSKRCIIVDDLSSVLIDNNGRDASLIQLFMKAVDACEYRKGKLIFIGSIYFPQYFMAESSRLIVLKSMERKYIERIVTYEMRTKGMASGEKDPEVPEKIYDIVKGHPLTAKLAIDVLEKNKNESFNDVDSKLLQSEIIKMLVEKIGLHEEAEETLQLLSVFRAIIHMPTLLQILPEEVCMQVKNDLKRILMFNFVNYDGENFEILESIRLHYYSLLRQNDEKKSILYEYAVQYYLKIYTAMKKENKFNPMIYSELAYYYLELGRLEDLKRLLSGNKEALKLHARTIYQQYHEYGAALQIYNIINQTFEDDPEVLAYIGRCNARMDNWAEVERYFKKAIETSKWKGDDTWYLYRDWGHILVRYNYVEEASQKFNKARAELRRETGASDDPAILAAEGYISEQFGDTRGAEDKYKEALGYNYAHKFTIYYYSKLLRKLGREGEAADLENRVENFNEGQTYENMVEYEFLSKSDENSFDDEY